MFLIVNQRYNQLFQIVLAKIHYLYEYTKKITTYLKCLSYIGQKFKQKHHQYMFSVIKNT